MKLLHVPAVLLAAGAAEEAEEAFLAAAARGAAGTAAAFGTSGRFSVSGVCKSQRTTQDSLVSDARVNLANSRGQEGRREGGRHVDELTRSFTMRLDGLVVKECFF